MAQLCKLRRAAAADQIRRVATIWCNGEILGGPLTVSSGDRGLTHGLGVFETVLSLDGNPLALDLHLQRMTSGAARLGLDARRIVMAEIAGAIQELLGQLGLVHGRARLRISLTSGSGELRNLSPGSDSILWITAAIAGDAPASVSLVTAPFPRNEASPLAGVKCFSYAENLLALDHARRMDADECLFYNTRGELCEATTSNIFLVREGKVLTPPLSSGCLPGTMRHRVIAACKELEIGAAELSLYQADLPGASEAFTSSAIRGVVPVSFIDEREMPDAIVAKRLALHLAAPTQASKR